MNSKPASLIGSAGDDTAFAGSPYGNGTTHQRRISKTLDFDKERIHIDMEDWL
jgi:hypothetical protein